MTENPSEREPSAFMQALKSPAMAFIGGLVVGSTTFIAPRLLEIRDIDHDLSVAVSETEKAVTDGKLRQGDVDKCTQADKTCEQELPKAVYACRERATKCLNVLLNPAAEINSATSATPDSRMPQGI